MVFKFLDKLLTLLSMSISVCQTTIYLTNFFRESDWFNFFEIFIYFSMGHSEYFVNIL